MLDYLNSLLPRIKQYSKDLDQIAKLYNQPWVVPGTDKHTMIIFQPSGKLIVSVDGVVSDGSWELIPAADAILLNIAGEKRLYHHGFLDSALWALRLVGKPEEVFVLVNQHLIPDLDVSGYLSMQYPKLVQDAPQSAIKYEKVLSLDDGGELQIGRDQGYGNTLARINNQIPEDGLYRTTSGGVFEIKNGALMNEFEIDRFEQSNGKVIEIVRHINSDSSEGCPVWIDGKPAPDGQYKRGSLSVHVKNGVIVEFHSSVYVVMVLIFWIVLQLMFLIVNLKTGDLKVLWPFNPDSNFQEYDISEFALYTLVPLFSWLIWRGIQRDST